MRAWWFLPVVAAAACTDDLPSYERIEDMRVLAVRADPPEVLQDGAAPIDMRFSALVLDPRGGPIEATWSFCPVEEGRACREFEELMEDVAEDPSAEVRALEPALRQMRTDLTAPAQTALPLDEIVTPPDDELAERGAWRYAVDDYAITAPAELYQYHLLTSALGGGLGAWPSAVLRLARPSEELLAAKRMVIGLQDLRFAASLIAAEFGYTVCPGNEPQPDCILIRDRTPNTNPVFVGVEVAAGDQAFGAEYRSIPIGPDGTVAGPVTVRAGEAIRVRPLIEQNEQADAGDRDAHPEYHYQSVRIELETEELFVDDLVEQVSVTWFVTGGSVEDTLTWPIFTKSLDTAYRAPSEPPAATNGRVTLWMVARDQRGGVAWMSVEIQVVP